MFKKNVFSITIVALVICSAFKIADHTIQQLNASEDAIKNAVVDAAINGKESSFNPYSVGLNNFTILKQIIQGKITLNKQETANNAIAYIKTYYKSAEFKTAYKEKLSAKFGRVTLEDSIALKKQYEQNLKSLELAFAQNKKYNTKEYIENSTNGRVSSAEQGMDKAMQMMLNNPQLAAQSGMTPEQIKQMLTEAKSKLAAGKQQVANEIDKQFDNGGEQKMQEDNQKSFETEKENLKQHYEDDLIALRKYLQASDVKGNMKAALKNVIEMIDNVDFNAELTTNKRFFVKKEYESKNANWKITYRAGKENATLVRAAATQWLGELK